MKEKLKEKLKINRAPAVAICGSSEITDPKVERISFELGFAVAEQGWTLVCGGKTGVMEAACRGVRCAVLEKGARGLAVGILPGGDFREANPYCDVVIPTGIGLARNSVVVRSGDAVVLVNGASGTLSEAAYAWQFGLPLVVMEDTGGWAEKLARMMRIDDRARSPLMRAGSAGEAVGLIKDVLVGPGG